MDWTTLWAKLRKLEQSGSSGGTSEVEIDQAALYELLGENTTVECSPDDIRYIIEAVKNKSPLYLGMTFPEGGVIIRQALTGIAYMASDGMEIVQTSTSITVGDDGVPTWQDWTFVINDSIGYAEITCQTKTLTT